MLHVSESTCSKELGPSSNSVAASGDGLNTAPSSDCCYKLGQE